MTRDINGYNGFGLLSTYDVYGCSLAANTAQSVVVPNNYENWIAIITATPGADIYVSFTTTATVPNGTMAALTSTLNPSARQVKGGQTISVITSSGSAPFVNIEFQVIAPYQN